MPTGFTDPLYTGKDITFEQFAWRCARGMTALASMRDEPLEAPIPERLEPDPYYARALASAEDEHARVLAMSEEECEREATKDHADLLASLKAASAERAARKTRYEAMLASVDAWHPPTPDHAGFKSFMHQQLVDSIAIDCGEMSMPEAPSAGQWRQRKLQQAARDLEQARREMVAQEERIQRCNQWIADLRASLSDKRVAPAGHTNG